MLITSTLATRCLNELLTEKYPLLSVIPGELQPVRRKLNAVLFGTLNLPETDPFLPILETIASALPLFTPADEDIFITFFSTFQAYINRLPDALRPGVNIKVANKIAVQLKRNIIEHQQPLPAINLLLIFSETDVREIAEFYLRLLNTIPDASSADLARVLENIDKPIDHLLHLKEILHESEIQQLVNVLCYTIKNAFNNFNLSLGRAVWLADRLTNAQINQIIEALFNTSCGRVSHTNFISGLFTFLNSLPVDASRLILHDKRLHNLIGNQLSNSPAPEDFFGRRAFVTSVVAFVAANFEYFFDSEQAKLFNTILEYFPEQITHELYLKFSNDQKQAASAKYLFLLKTFNFHKDKFDQKVFDALPLFKMDFAADDIIEFVNEHVRLSRASCDPEVIEFTVIKIIHVMSLANQAIVNDILLSLLTILQFNKNIPRRHHETKIILAFVNNFDVIYKYNHAVYLNLVFEYLADKFFYTDLVAVVRLGNIKIKRQYWEKLVSAVLAQPSHPSYLTALGSLATVIPALYLDKAIAGLCQSARNNARTGLSQLATIVSRYSLSFDNELQLFNLIRFYVDDFARNPLSYKSFDSAEMFRCIVTIGQALSSHAPLDYIINVMLKTYHQLDAEKQLAHYHYQTIFNNIFTAISRFRYHPDIDVIARQLFIRSGGANPQLLINLFQHAPDLTARIAIVVTLLEMNAKQDYWAIPVLDTFLKFNSLQTEELLPICEAVASVKGNSIKRRQAVLINLIQRLDNKSRIQFVNNMSKDHGDFQKYMFLYVRSLNQMSVISSYHFGLFSKRACGPDIILNIEAFCKEDSALLRSEIPVIRRSGH